MSKSYMNLDVTYNYAVEKLKVKDPQEIARDAGVLYDQDNRKFSVDYLGDKCAVSYPDGAVEFGDKKEEVPMTTKILMLHYLAYANGAPLQDKWISFKELPDGGIYIDPFTNRAIRPMISIFSGRQEDFVSLAQSVGGRKEKLGDTSVTVCPFPRVPITYVLYSADDEFPASGNILFDGSASCYLPTEDYAILASLVVYHLGKMLPKQ